MQNPLVQSATELAKCGIEKRHNGDFSYRSPRFYHLASKLLSNENEVFSLQRKSYGFKGENKVAIAFSGGMLSWCSAYLCLKDGFYTALVYCYRADEYVRENHYAGIDFAITYGKLFKNNLSLFLELTDISVKDEYPGRNLILAAVCSGHAKRIWLPITQDQVDRDCSSAFFRESSQLFTEFYGQPHWVQATTSHQTREQLVQEYLHKGGTLQDLAKSISCRSLVEGKHCGVCSHCYRRYSTFQKFNYEVSFAVHPKDSPNYFKFRGEFK